MATPAKDTVYIDVDDEITSIIDKVQASNNKIVALVLPKRAVTLQSIVNMRLLKRAGEEQGKRVVLITSETNLLSLAGIVGLFTAKTLQSKPIIPPTPDSNVSSETLVDDGTSEPEPEIDTHKSVGELSGMPVAETSPLLPTEETIDVDNTEDGKQTEIGAAKGSKKDKIKIPNFESFRLRVILGVVALVLLIAGWIFAAIVLPKASVTVRTDTTSVTSNIGFTAQTDAKTVNLEQSIIPATNQEVKKTDSAKVAATGKKNTGTAATGTMTVYNCTDTDVTIPAGTLFTNNGLSFASTAAVAVPASNFTSGGVCKKDTHATASVTATSGGGTYNLNAGRSYTSNFASTLTGVGSAMTGGTDNLITVIAQADIDKAAASLVDKSKDAAVTDLTKLAQTAKLIALPETLTASSPTVTNVPNVGDEAADVTVTSVTTYDMLSVKLDQLQQLVSKDVKKQIDITKQPIIDYGLTKVLYHFASKRSPSDQSLTFQTIATAGTKIDPEALKKEIVGKKKGDVIRIVSAHPGVKDVNVSYSPFWVNKIPKKLNRTTVVFEQANGK